MTNLDALCQQTLERHQQILAEAARRRLLSSSLPGRATDGTGRRWRIAVAAWLRRTADRLEPVADLPQVAMLRDRVTR